MRQSLVWMLLGVIGPAYCEPDDYAGPAACQSCHPAQYAVQTKSRHCFALRPILETPLPSLLAAAPIRERSGISFEYEEAADGLLVKVRRGNDRREALLEWAFGSGAQAYTPVGRRNGRYFEHRVSFYTLPRRPGRTLGHSGEASRTLEAALGPVQDSETISRCFHCHSTGSKAGPDLSGMRPGINCERCHGPGTAHIAAARAGRREALTGMVAVSRLSPRDSVLFCGQCHRSPPPGSALTQPEVDDPLSIRFQPIGLMASQCFRKSGDLSCITCHNPHEDAHHDAEHYVVRCLRCHDAETGKSRSSCGLGRRQNCLPCHMQRRSPVQFLTFTDHRIRVYR